jgi:hypothetical protein
MLFNNKRVDTDRENHTAYKKNEKKHEKIICVGESQLPSPSQETLLKITAN